MDESRNEEEEELVRVEIERAEIAISLLSSARGYRRFDTGIRSSQWAAESEALVTQRREQ